MLVNRFQLHVFTCNQSSLRLIYKMVYSILQLFTWNFSNSIDDSLRYFHSTNSQWIIQYVSSIYNHFTIQILELFHFLRYHLIAIRRDSQTNNYHIFAFIKLKTYYSNIVKVEDDVIDSLNSVMFVIVLLIQQLFLYRNKNTPLKRDVRCVRIRG